MHIHLGVGEGIRIFTYVLAFGTLWRLISMWLANTDFGKAMAVAY